MAKKQIAVIGLGRFGLSVVRELSALGHEVLSIDTDMRAVETAAEVATQAVQADATDEGNLRELGVGEFDAAIVGAGTDLKSSILITLALKRLGVRTIVAKAQDERHGEILTKIGADRVVYPERDTAARLAHSLASPTGVVDYMEVSPSYGVARIIVPQAWAGRMLEEIDLRGRFGVHVLIVRSGEKLIVNPSRHESLRAGDTLIVSGADANLDTLQIG